MEMTEEIKKALSEYHEKLSDDLSDEFYGFCVPDELLGFPVKEIRIPNKFTDTRTIDNWHDSFFVYCKDDITLRNVEFKKDIKYKFNCGDIVTDCLFYNDDEWGELRMDFDPITTKTELVENFLTESEYLKDKRTEKLKELEWNQFLQEKKNRI